MRSIWLALTLALAGSLPQARSAGAASLLTTLPTTHLTGVSTAVLTGHTVIQAPPAAPPGDFTLQVGYSELARMTDATLFQILNGPNCSQAFPENALPVCGWQNGRDNNNPAKCAAYSANGYVVGWRPVLDARIYECNELPVGTLYEPSKMDWDPNGNFYLQDQYTPTPSGTKLLSTVPVGGASGGVGAAQMKLSMASTSRTG